MAQAKIWALTTVSEKRELGLTQQEIADSVTKVGGGHPTQKAISNLQAQFGKDDDWYPGKNMDNAKNGGRKPVFTKQRKQAVANAAMALKKAGVEPTAAAVRERCPVATHNDETGEPLTDKCILEVLRTRCYDEGSEEPWDRVRPYQRWMSRDTRTRARNSRASPYAGKQARFGDKRVWWFVVLTRGQVNFVMMADHWQQNGEGKIFQQRVLK